MSSHFDAMTMLAERLSGHGIVLSVQRKSVKNINFRIKAGVLSVSAPMRIGESQLIAAITDRLDWAVAAHRSLMTRQSRPDRLWGECFDVNAWMDNHGSSCRNSQRLMDDDARLQWIYRHEINEQLPLLIQKWQSIVGKQAASIRLRYMRSRWGSCNVRTAKITLNTQLAAYPKRCLEYVLVHELCHLHHANHSADFWASVKQAMPDYRHWHSLLNHKTRTL